MNDTKERTLREVIAEIENENPDLLDEHCYILLTADADRERNEPGICAIGCTGGESIAMVCSMVHAVAVAEGNPLVPEFYIDELENVSRMVLKHFVMKPEGEKDESED